MFGITVARPAFCTILLTFNVLVVTTSTTRVAVSLNSFNAHSKVDRMSAAVRTFFRVLGLTHSSSRTASA